MAPGAIVIVGSGQAGFQVAASLRDGGFDGRITVVGDEVGLPYQRPPLSKTFLLSDSTPESVLLRSNEFYREERIEVRDSTCVEMLDRQRRRIVLASGETVAYDHLVIATGARARGLRVPGADLDGVVTLRGLADAIRLRPLLQAAQRVVVVGAGFIGLELAAVCKTLGVQVHVVDAAERPLSRVVSPDTAAFFERRHKDWGTRFSFQTATSSIVGVDGVAVGVETTGGKRIMGDIVIVAIGVAPNAELVEASALPVQDGVMVDRELLTPDPSISAIGDCASFPTKAGRLRLESVQNAVDHGRCVAERLLGRPARYAKTPWFWSDQRDLRLQIAGVGRGYDRAALRGDPESGKFSRFLFSRGQLVAVESVNRPGDHMAARKLLTERRPLTYELAEDESFDIGAYASGRQTLHADASSSGNPT